MLDLIAPSNATVRDEVGGGGARATGESPWVGDARFAIEGVAQGLVGLFGLVGE